MNNYLWWQTTMPWYKRLWYMYKYRGHRMGDALDNIYEHAVKRAQDGGT